MGEKIKTETCMGVLNFESLISLKIGSKHLTDTSELATKITSHNKLLSESYGSFIFGPRREALGNIESVTSTVVIQGAVQLPLDESQEVLWCEINPKKARTSKIKKIKMRKILYTLNCPLDLQVIRAM